MKTHWLRLARVILWASIMLSIAACGSVPATPAHSSGISPISTLPSNPGSPQAIPVFSYKVIRGYPHDRAAYTEGLAFDNQGTLYESTGLNGRSSLRRVDLNSGQVLQSIDLSPQYFGEGITIVGDEIIQLTWKTHVGFVYDKASFKLLKTFSYATEGWGLTNDGQQLIMSDGTATLHFLTTNTFQEIKQIQVHDNHGPVVMLNELEYIQGEIFANIWQTDRIVRISPDTGQVLGWLVLTGLDAQLDRSQPIDVLNGIAYDAPRDRLFVTGKLWPQLFEITLERTAGS